MRPSLRRRGMTSFAVSTGTAKPMPVLPPADVRIWALTPITRPRASSSGPPELPGLIAASVCRTLPIEKPSCSDGIWRWTAEMTPVVSVRSRPNGLPIASAGSPTATSLEMPSSSACRSSPSGSTSSSARSVDGSAPGDLRDGDLRVREAHRHPLGVADDVGVREDRAAAPEDEARARRRARLRRPPIRARGRRRRRGRRGGRWRARVSAPFGASARSPGDVEKSSSPPPSPTPASAAARRRRRCRRAGRRGSGEMARRH